MMEQSGERGAQDSLRFVSRPAIERLENAEKRAVRQRRVLDTFAVGFLVVSILAYPGWILASIVFFRNIDLTVVLLASAPGPVPGLLAWRWLLGWSQKYQHDIERLGLAIAIMEGIEVEFRDQHVSPETARSFQRRLLEVSGRVLRVIAPVPVEVHTHDDFGLESSTE